MTEQNDNSPDNRPSCLVIEDDEEIREALSETVSGVVKVRSVGDGLAAMELLMAKRFDVILCDINLPLISGPGILEEMMEKKIDTPVIFVSGALEPGIVKKVNDLGAFAVLEKPFPFRELIRLINEAIKKKSA